MKSIFLIALFLPVFSFASENCTTDTSDETVEDQLVISTDVPRHLEGATIIVRTKDGRESSVPAERFKVVPRTQQFITTKTKQTTQTVCQAERLKNRISLLAGKGPQAGLNTNRTPTEVTVESRVGTVGGIQYQRETDLKLFGMPVSGGVQVQNNESALGVVGFGF